MKKTYIMPSMMLIAVGNVSILDGSDQGYHLGGKTGGEDNRTDLGIDQGEGDALSKRGDFSFFDDL